MKFSNTKISSRPLYVGNVMFKYERDIFKYKRSYKSYNILFYKDRFKTETKCMMQKIKLSNFSY
jgi:hypothetical protein